jgi:glycosyltransferase involved in cell wall biosynthesis
VGALHLEKDVLLIGNVPEIEKPLKAADIFVAPYLWEEPFGLSVVEAMAAGLPVVGAISGSLVELLGGGKFGLLFEKGNIPDLASCLLRYAKDAVLRSEMGKAARQEALEYASFKMCERIQKVYENVLKEKA